MTRHALVITILLSVLAPGARTRAAEGIVLLPASFELTNPESRQHLILQQLDRGEVAHQVAEKVDWSSSDPKVATVADGVVTPAHDGQTTITARASARRPRPRWSSPEWAARSTGASAITSSRCSRSSAATRSLPRRTRGQGRLPALAPRLRSRDRLLQHRQARPRPPRRALRPRAQPGPRQAVRCDRAQRGRPVPDQLARLPDPGRMVERRRCAPQGR